MVPNSSMMYHDFLPKTPPKNVFDVYMLCQNSGKI